MSLFLTVKENESGNSAHSTREEEKHTELTDHIGDERLARLGMPNEGYSLIGDEVEEEVRYRKNTKTDDQGDQGKP